MPLFTAGPNLKTPFGKKYYLRSTQDVKTASATIASSTVPTEVVDGVDTKVWNPGVLVAKITSGAEIDKVGPYDPTATDGREDLANVLGVNETFLPTQMLHGDTQIAVVYEASLVTAWVYEFDGTNFIQVLPATMAAIHNTIQTKFTFH